MALDAVNTLWFSSLVLSIGSAINGLLAMTWRQAVLWVRLSFTRNPKSQFALVSSTPKRALPWYIQFWVRQGYLVLLIASVVAFLGGLILYMFVTQVSSERK